MKYVKLVSAETVCHRASRVTLSGTGTNVHKASQVIGESAGCPTTTRLAVLFAAYHDILIFFVCIPALYGSKQWASCNPQITA
jgi:hypothetical protein